MICVAFISFRATRFQHYSFSYNFCKILRITKDHSKDNEISPVVLISINIIFTITVPILGWWASYPCFVWSYVSIKAKLLLEAKSVLVYSQVSV